MNTLSQNNENNEIRQTNLLNYIENCETEIPITKASTPSSIKCFQFLLT